jgi:hypothetical protein
MPAVHFVERLNNVHRVPDAPGEWESGYWVVSEETAARLVGGDLYLHFGQGEPSHFGGRIISYRVYRDDTGSEIDGRILFRIRPSLEYKGVVTERQGWGNEKKFVW